MVPLLSWKVLTFLAVTTFTSAASAANCWQYKGCYNETDSIHPLQFKILPSLTEDTNNENCQSACLAAGYLLSGTADAFNCWCDNVMNPKSNKLLESYCNDPCDTVTTETCGGYYAVSVYNDTCLSTPPNPSKTIIITAAPKPTNSTSVPVHTIYTTAVVPGPGRTSQAPPIQTVTTYVQPPSSNPYSASRQRPPVYSRTTESYSQPTDTCNDILCCLFDPNCDSSRFSNSNNIFSLAIGDTNPAVQTKVKREEAHHSKESSWWSQSQWDWSTSTIFSTTSYTITSCPPYITSCGVGSTTVETILVSTTVCPITETPSSWTVIPTSPSVSVSEVAVTTSTGETIELTS